MDFLSAMFLWALPLAAVPVIVHLLNRRRRDVVRWGAMKFLIEAVSRRRKIWRIEDLLLMLLRTAAVLAFIFALARPLLWSSWLGGRGPRDVVLVLDTSMSTAQTNSSTTLFEKQLVRADELIDDLADGDFVRVLLAGATPEWLIPVGVPVNDEVKRELRGQLHELQPTLGSADMMRCLQEAADAVPADEKAARTVALLTDGQTHGWRPEAAQMWRSLKDGIESQDAPAVVNVISLGDPDRAVANLSVGSLAASRGLVGSEPVAFSAKVKNTGHLDSPATLLSWMEAGEPIGVTTVPALEAGEEVSLDIKHAIDSPGVYEITCRIKANDDLLMDNVGRFVIEVVERVPILVVDGASWARHLETEAGYLLLSLGQGSSKTEEDSGWRSVFDPEVVDLSALGSKRLTDYRCVVLANVEQLPDETVAHLADYVEQGGGLWMALGDQTDPSFFNSMIAGAGRALSPLALAEAIGDANDDENAVELRPPSAQHTATALLADTERLDIDRVRIRRRHRFEMIEKNDASIGGDASIGDDTSTGGDASTGGKGVSVLLSTSQGEPVVIEKVLGRGRIIVQGIPLTVDWSNLPACQAFVVMTHEWLWYLSEPTMTRWNLDVGEALTTSQAGEAPDQIPEVVTPRGEKKAATVEERDGRCVYEYVGTLVPGGYKLTVRNGGEAPGEFPFHVRRDADESELEVLDEADTDALTMAGGLQFVDNPLAAGMGRSSPRRSEPLWTWLLVSLLAVLVIESVIAGQLSRRRMARAPAVVIEE